MPDLESNQTNIDAKEMAEDIAKGEQEQPKVNVEADYEPSKEFAVADVDKTGAGAEAAKAATEPKQKMPEPTDMHSDATGSDANPEDYREMAKEVNPRL